MCVCVCVFVFPDGLFRLVQRELLDMGVSFFVTPPADIP